MRSSTQLWERHGRAIALRILSSDARCSMVNVPLEAEMHYIQAQNSSHTLRETLGNIRNTPWRALNSRSGWLLCLAAASAAGLAATQCLSESRCEGGSSDSISESEVRQAVNDLWASLEEQIDRLQASYGTIKVLPRIPKPEIEFSDKEVAVTFKIPQEFNIKGAATALRRHLLTQRPEDRSNVYAAASTSEESTSGPRGRARRIRRSSDAFGDLTVDVLEPYEMSEPALFEFRGAPTRANLSTLSKTLQVAVTPPQFSERQGVDSLAKLFGGDFQFGGRSDSLGDGLGPFFTPLRELLEEFERMHGEHMQGMLNSNGTSDRGLDGSHRGTLPHRRLPKRFDESTPDATLQGPYDTPQAQSAIRKLRDMGAQVFLPSSSSAAAAGTNPTVDAEKVDWGGLAGYEEQKRSIEDCLLLPLLRPEVYDSVAKGTRRTFAPNRPRAVLFVGPPGTGKTSSARVIAAQAAVPLVYLPLEALVSKWYGESEKQLAEALAAADSLPTGCIVFLDELDALATQRGGEMHEATRRLLGVLLRHMDGFDSKKRSVVVGATNRPQDLDPALISRFSAMVEFGLPSQECRAAILRQYAAHLKDVEVIALAAATPGVAGRDLRDVCEQAERRWASKIIRGQATEGQLPPLDEYMSAADARLREIGGVPPMRLKM